MQIPQINISGQVKMPFSKSVSNRILIIEALSGKKFNIHNLSMANDTLVLKKCLTAVNESKSRITLDIEDAGTPFRFLVAYLAIQDGREFILTGNKRLCERPINDLVIALRRIGADIHYIEQKEFAPLLIRGRKLTGGDVSIHASVSSQFISALCLIAPSTEKGLKIKLDGDVISDTYIKMTLELMKQFGIDAAYSPPFISIKPQSYQAAEYDIEGDWSSATFFYAMAMMASKVELRITSLLDDSLQGDKYIKELANEFGIETFFEENTCLLKKERFVEVEKRHYNLANYPDLAIPMIVACAIAHPEVSFSGLLHLEFKESKRISCLQSELKKVGVELNYNNAILSFKQLTHHLPRQQILFNTYNDHRIAMAMYMLRMLGIDLILDNYTCVAKSFPGFFEEYEKGITTI